MAGVILLATLITCGPASTLSQQSSAPSATATAATHDAGAAESPPSATGPAAEPSATGPAAEPSARAAWLTYDPGAASHLDRIRQARWLGFDAAAEAQLQARGMVVIDHPRPSSFATGLAEIFHSDLPIWITADSVLYALHRSFEDTLGVVEEARGLPLLDALLRTTRRALPRVRATPETRAEVDEYLTIAASLAAGRDLPCSANGSSEAAWTTTRAIVAASGSGTIDRFGQRRKEDFSLYAPRGHYAKSAALTRYFRAMTWLRRVPVVLVRTDKRAPTLVTRGLQAAQVLARCLRSDGGGAYRRFDRFITSLVGPRESLDPQQLRPLERASRGSALTELTRTRAERLVQLGFGSLSLTPERGDWITLSLVGQRVPPDTRTFDAVVQERFALWSQLPTALEVGWVALGHGSARHWLPARLAAVHPIDRLAALGTAIDGLPADYWRSSLYTRWLGALRTLAPDRAGAQSSIQRPTIVASEPWARRLLATQLASWAELRHDSALYLQLSRAYAVCEFPDAYVDPYPELWAALRAWVDAVRQVVVASGAQGKPAERVRAWCHRAGTILARLEAIARRQGRGEPLAAADLDWINRAAQLESVDCVGRVHQLKGWYAQLFVDPSRSLVPTPLVAPVLRIEEGMGSHPILHAGVGDPRVMVLAIEGPAGPRSFVGLVSSFYEHWNDSALDDERWRAKVRPPGLAPPAWYEPLLAP